MRILITNDDGMHASQLIPLVRWCRKLGDVTVVVPKVEQSAKSHGIEIHKTFEAKQVELAPDVTAWAVDSTPADCVRFAVLGQKMNFDLVISGINRGLNIGTDVMYSGTAAAVFEAGNLGLPAIALSTEPKYYDHATDHLDMVLDFFLKNKLMDVHSLYNVNIPFNVKGIRICRQGGHYYSDDFLPQGNDMYLPKGVCVYEADDDYTIDTHAALNGYISVSPLTIIRTDMEIYNKLTYLNP